MANIFLSIPVLDTPQLQMIYTMYQSILSCREHKVRVYFNSQDSLISRVRNCHISAFLNEHKECDYFMSLDSDIELVNVFPSSNLFTKLIAHDVDFCGGLYAIKKPGVVRCSSISMDSEPPEFDTGLKEMRWLSSGCWCLKRKVVEQMVAAYPELNYDGDDNATGKTIHGLYIPFIYDMTKENFPEHIKGDKPFRKYLSEDWAFPLDPETMVLCDNFRWKPIRDVNIGETLIAFDEYATPNNQKRQMIKSKVTDKIYKNLPRVKIVTENGQEIITTSDHQWLIKRGWRDNSRAGRKNGERKNNPCKSYWEKTGNLRTGDYLYNVVDNVPNPDINNPDYMTGYLNGMWDGDGCICKSKKWNSYRIDVRVCDFEIVKRLEVILTKFGIQYIITPPKKHDDNPKHRPLGSIRVRSHPKNINMFFALYDGRKNASSHSDEFCRGYMAGIFDAEGHYSGASIDISQWEFPEVVKKIAMYSKQIGYKFYRDSRRFRLTNCYKIHRFFIETCPATSRKMHLGGQTKGKDRLIMPQRKVKIKKIVSLNEAGKMICLVTESGTFIAEGIATHNCDRWRRLGGKIFADTSIVLRHIGKHNYNLFNVEVVQKSGTPPPPPGFDLK